ncbi:hypothetical protein KI688_009909 [Linnemannia hyalina]|uniref:Uncharacterized protein n=1 Tax=Linnemannia hyalina TaxID=64524 RepID=A0A9P7XWZ7_9FUNG|nr:hypothetical protein KI688_009909 [Linnemannia hyalina]
MSNPGYTATLLMSPGTALLTNAEMAQQQQWIQIHLTRRMVSWHYLHNCFRGGVVFCNTALISEDDMRSAWTEEKMYRRTLQFFFTGTSLATILEIPDTADFLKTLINLLQEYDAFGTAEARSKSIFSKGRKTTTDGMIIDEQGEYSYLEVRHIPFALDYTITASTLCEMMCTVYEKLRTSFIAERPWTLSIIEYFQRADNRIKKILQMVYKEFEAIARESMFKELNYLIDPMAAITSLSPRYDHDWEI